MIIRGLDDTDQPILLYAAKAALLSISVGGLVGIVIGSFFSSVGARPQEEGDPLALMVSLLLVVPMVETALMAPLLALILKRVSNRYAACVISALMWALIHSCFWIYWGLFVFFPFLVFSFCFLAWSRISTRRAILVTALAHMIHNLGPTMLMVYGA
ncbi:MAG: CPBP family glutamic-type intramembrane protease [Verrucomicrobiota bacterium]